MAPDRTILHLVKKKIPNPLPLSRIMACTLLSLSYAPGNPHGKLKENLFLPLFNTNFISKAVKRVKCGERHETF